MKTVAFLFFLFCLFSQLFAQEEYYKERVDLQFNPMLGFNGTLNSIKSGDFSDELVEFEEYEFYVEYLSLTAYIYKDWGLSVRLQHVLRDKEEDYRFNFSNSLVERFNDDYFLPNPYNPELIEGNSGFIANNTPKIYVGITRRILYDKFEFYPSIYVGYSQIELLNYSAIFKKRNSNRILAYSIKNNYGDEDVVNNVEFALGVRVGYRFKDYLLAQVNLQYSYSQLDLTYVDEEQDLYTKQKRIHTFDYPNAIHAYSIGIGVIFEMNNL